MICGICKINEEVNKKRNICASCYAKDYRKHNQDKIKAYNKKMEKPQKKWRKDYYKKNMEKLKGYQKEAGKTEEFKKKRREKSKSHVETIRRKTRVKYPLKGNKCVKCNLDAKHRHHTTNPIEINKFLFLCHKHHMEEHGKNSYDKKFAKQEKAE